MIPHSLRPLCIDGEKCERIRCICANDDLSELKHFKQLTEQNFHNKHYYLTTSYKTTIAIYNQRIAELELIELISRDST